MQFLHGPLTAVLCLSLVSPAALVADSASASNNHNAKRASGRAT